MRSLHAVGRSLAVVVLISTGGLLSARAGSLAKVTPSARACFASEQPQVCNRALVLAEDLQRKASDLDRYPCQSLLLGLQAEVVMVQLGAGRGAQANETLVAVQRRCHGL